MKGKYNLPKRLLADTIIGMLCFLLALLSMHSKFMNEAWEDLLVSLRFFGKGLTYYQEPVIIKIDDNSIQRFGPWPWQRSKYVEALQILELEGASVVGIDLLFQSPDPENDAKLAQVLRDTKIALVLGEELELGLVKTFNRQSWINQGAKPSLFPNTPKGYLNLVQDKDGFFRKWPLPTGIKEIAFVEQIYQLATKEKAPKIDRGVISFVGNLEAFPSVSFYQLLEGDYPPNYFSKKIVLLGITGKNIDRHAVALPALGTIPGVYLHAYLLRNLLEKSWLEHLSPWLSSILFLGIILCWTLFLRNRKGLLLFLVTISAIAGSLLMGLISSFWGYILPVPSIVILLLLKPIILLIQSYHLEIKERQKIKGLFSKYVSPEILEEILERRQNINFAGERRFVAIFFADVREFTEFTENNPPELVVSEINQIMARMAEIVRTHGGLVNKFLGDGIMAVFGIPIWEESMLEQVFAACQEIVDIEGVYIDKRLQIGIGLAWGVAVTGSVGSENRMEYTVMGSPVNLAARLEKLARPREIVFSFDERYKGKPWLPPYCLEEVKVKGLNNMVRVGRIKKKIN